MKKLFSWTKNIKFNARPDGTFKYEKSTNMTIKTPNGMSVVKVLSKVIAYATKVYRMIKSKFSS